ncbi:hypothetical protein FRC05_004264 [Tulasnella sp. 425]|nr:hypothetical protein FRC05_004264 [Tulasnella sp. 425]
MDLFLNWKLENKLPNLPWTDWEWRKVGSDDTDPGELERLQEAFIEQKDYFLTESSDDEFVLDVGDAGLEGNGSVLYFIQKGNRTGSILSTIFHTPLQCRSFVFMVRLVFNSAGNGKFVRGIISPVFDFTPVQAITATSYPAGENIAETLVWRQELGRSMPSPDGPSLMIQAHSAQTLVRRKAGSQKCIFSLRS